MYTNKILILDSLRAFAALSVCLFHFVYTTIGFVDTQWIRDLFSVGKYGVQMFFVISGFVIPWAMHQSNYQIRNFFSFFLKRLARLEPPYIFSLILTLVILFLREKFLGKSNEHLNLNGQQVLLHIGYLIPFFEGYHWLNMVYWTLAVEFQYYILIAILFIPFTKSNVLVRVVIYLLFLVGGLTDNDSFLLYWLPLFLIGISLFLFISKYISRAEYLILNIVLILFSLYKYPLAAIVFILIPIVFILFFKDQKIKGLNFIGKFSYSIYLIHPIIGASFINICSHYVDNAFIKLLVILGGMLLTFLISGLTYILVEQPSKNFSASIKYRLDKP